MVGKQGDHLSPFKVADDRAISIIGTPRPVIDAINARRHWRQIIIPANGSKQLVIANRQPKTIRKSCIRAAI